jgi:AAA-like domain/TIR domain
MARIFISYKRNIEPDEPLALKLHELLKEEHGVFIDRTILLGQDWVKQIQNEVQSADFLILLLSEHSAQSQMVAEELRMAEAARRQNGKPKVLPVRVNFDGVLPYDLGAILNRTQYARWRSPDDTSPLFSQLKAAIGGGVLPETQPLKGAGLAPDIPLPAANPIATLEAPEGTMAAESPFYVNRSADAIAKDEQAHSAYTLTIKGPRQMGKSSLLGRLMAQASMRGTRVAFLDFQAFGGDVLKDPDQFYPQFCFLIEDALDLPSRIDEFWKPPLAPTQKCRRLMERYILSACGDSGLLLAIDEADSLLDSPLRSDFFGMLRSWHNLRTTAVPWKRFSIAMAISSEPGLLIDNLSQSPFNVGTILSLEDFSLEETRAANELHGSPLKGSNLNQLHELLRGHPYLTRRALYLICKARYSLPKLLAEADSETGPFGDHLRALLSRLGRRPEVQPALKAALSTGHCQDGPRHRLMAGGLLIEEGGRVVARNELYNRYFKRVLNG